MENIGRATDSPSIRGYLSSLALLPSGVVVAGQDSARTWFCAADTSVPDKAGSFFFVSEGPSPSLSRTATAPPCVTALLSDPAGPGFLAVFGLGPQRLGRFDAEARLVADVEIPDVAPEARWVLSAALSGDLSRVLLLLAESDGVSRPNAGAGLAVQFDARTLAVVSPPVGTVDHSEALVAVGPQDFLVFEGDDAGGCWSTPPAPTPRSRAGCPAAALQKATSGSCAGRRSRDNASSSPPAALLLLVVERDRPACGAAVPFEHELEPYAVATWPGHAGRALFGGQGRNQDAYVGIIDVEGARVLRGATPVGRGQVTELVVAPGGAIWALLPGSAAVVRLEP